MSSQPPASRSSRSPREYLYIARFALIHLLCFAAIWTGVTLEALVLCVVLYVVRMFAVTAGYHRYFSHRTYKMGRVMQFVMAFLAQTSAQKGVLWWASHHRHHHKYSDTPEDVHSARQDGLWWSHVGWVLSSKWSETDMSRVKDLARYPELRFLNRYSMLPPTLLAIACLLAFGWSGLVVGFLWSTVLLWHATFTINSLAHLIGTRRYETDDDSRNNWFLAVITFGEGWHNNHHHYQASANQGFFWWEIDLTYYVLWAMSKVGLVSDLRRPPRHVIEGRPHPGASLAGKLEASAHRARDEAARKVGELRQSAREACNDAARKVGELSESTHKALRPEADPEPDPTT